MVVFDTYLLAFSVFGLILHFKNDAEIWFIFSLKVVFSSEFS